VKLPTLPCAIYTRKSSEEGLEQGFNSLDAQREACSAYILSQKALGWSALPGLYVRAKEMGRSLLDGSMGGSTVADCIKQVRVGSDRISIELRPSALGGEQGSEHPAVVIEMPMQMKRCGQAVRFIVQSPSLLQTGTPDPKLIALLARAHDWFGRLSSGTDVEVSSIAAASGFSASYVTRVMYLAFLAPDIVRRIVKGDHPPDLGTDRLMRSVPLPLSWAEQRSALGFDR